MSEIREHRIGTVSHWYSHLGVAAIDLTDGDLHVGDRVHIIGHTTDLMQPIHSMQIDHHPVNEAHPGESVGVKVGDHVREHDEVYIVDEA
jgi:putative protease